jgi:hypothetical protein
MNALTRGHDDMAPDNTRPPERNGGVVKAREEKLNKRWPKPARSSASAVKIWKGFR